MIQGSNPHLLCLLHWQAGYFLFFLTNEPPGKPKGHSTSVKAAITLYLPLQGLVLNLLYSLVVLIWFLQIL